VSTPLSVEEISKFKSVTIVCEFNKIPLTKFQVINPETPAKAE
jgi:hypothetical protein